MKMGYFDECQLRLEALRLAMESPVSSSKRDAASIVSIASVYYAFLSSRKIEVDDENRAAVAADYAVFAS